MPANPRAWLVSTGRFKAIDGIRRRSRFDTGLEDVVERLAAEEADPADAMDETLPDDRLRLVFTCCHPALGPDAQVAMTLREVCGLTTEEIASAFLVPPATLAQRIVRAKTKIRDAAIPYQVPSLAELPARLDAVLRVVYLVFNEGYAASTGESLTRTDLSAEAIRLGRMLLELLPEPEVAGLVALMLLQDSRREARTTAAGDVVLLDEQDRSLWNREQIGEGLALRRPRAETAGHDEDVGLGAVGEGVVGRDLQSVAGEERAGLFCHREGVEEFPVVQLVRDGEDLEGPAEIEHLDIRENEDGDVALHGDMA